LNSKDIRPSAFPEGSGLERDRAPFQVEDMLLLELIIALANIVI
jgi:hypothetical protein